MSTVRVGGVRFRIHPQDHAPIHAHARYAETVAIVELRAAGQNYDDIRSAWEHMQREI